MYEVNSRKRNNRESISLDQLQEILRSGKKNGFEIKPDQLRDNLAALEERLLRVRSWGGLYGKIEFSPYVRTILNDCSKELHQVVAS